MSGKRWEVLQQRAWFRRTHRPSSCSATPGSAASAVTGRPVSGPSGQPASETQASSDGKLGTMRITDNSHPFRVAAITGAPHVDTDYNRGWVVSRSSTWLRGFGCRTRFGGQALRET
jgi:hypothetical protein